MQNPMPDAGKTDVIARLLKADAIAVVGISDDPSRASFAVATYLRSHGKRLFPVNPNLQDWGGIRCFADLRAIPERVDLVNVFRRAEFCAEIVKEAIAIGAKGIWLQSGIENEQSRAMAEEAGFDFVQNRCLMVEHSRRLI